MTGTGYWIIATSNDSSHELTLPVLAIGENENHFYSRLSGED